MKRMLGAIVLVLAVSVASVEANHEDWDFSIGLAAKVNSDYNKNVWTAETRYNQFGNLSIYGGADVDNEMYSPRLGFEVALSDKTDSIRLNVRVGGRVLAGIDMDKRLSNPDIRGTVGAALELGRRIGVRLAVDQDISGEASNRQTVFRGGLFFGF